MKRLSAAYPAVQPISSAERCSRFFGWRESYIQVDTLIRISDTVKCPALVDHYTSNRFKMFIFNLIWPSEFQSIAFIALLGELIVMT